MIIILIQQVNVNENYYYLSALRVPERGHLERSGDASSAVEALSPVTAFHALDAHFRARFGRVDESSISNVDAHMRIGAPKGVVEDKIARLELGALDAGADFALSLRIPRQAHAKRLQVDVRYEAAAIKAAFACLSAVSVIDAKRGQNVKHEFRFRRGCLTWRGSHSAGRLRRWRSLPDGDRRRRLNENATATGDYRAKQYY